MVKSWTLTSAEASEDWCDLLLFWFVLWPAGWVITTVGVILADQPLPGRLTALQAGALVGAFCDLLLCFFTSDMACKWFVNLIILVEIRSLCGLVNLNSFFKICQGDQLLFPSRTNWNHNAKKKKAKTVEICKEQIFVCSRCYCMWSKSIHSLQNVPERLEVNPPNFHAFIKATDNWWKALTCWVTCMV